jgi:2-hydroxychromene-2-carboxylate isomerase
MRGAYAAIEAGCFEVYVDTLYSGLWQQELNLSDAEIIKATLVAAGLDADKLMALTQQQHIKDALIVATEEVVARGAFGAPTMYIGDEMFFGQDRIDFIEERLKG